MQFNGQITGPPWYAMGQYGTTMVCNGPIWGHHAMQWANMGPQWTNVGEHRGAQNEPTWRPQWINSTMKPHWTETAFDQYKAYIIVQTSHENDTCIRPIWEMRNIKLHDKFGRKWVMTDSTIKYWHKSKLTFPTTVVYIILSTAHFFIDRGYILSAWNVIARTNHKRQTNYLYKHNTETTCVLDFFVFTKL